MKRFTDTAKWSDPWFRRLSGPAKMLWFYILDHCDHVGMIEIDLALASQDCGIKIPDSALLELGARLEPAGQGKMIVPKFIKFQIGDPRPSCPAHGKVCQSIEELSLYRDALGYHYPSGRLPVVYPKGNNTLKEKEEDKDKDKEEEKEEDKTRAKPKPKPSDKTECDDFLKSTGLYPRDSEWFWHKMEGNGWTNGGKKVKDWKATVRSWKAAGYFPSIKSPTDYEKDWPQEMPVKADSSPVDDEWRNERGETLWEQLKRLKSEELADNGDEPDPSEIQPLEEGKCF
jgi:hypothetical protein